MEIDSASPFNITRRASHLGRPRQRKNKCERQELYPEAKAHLRPNPSSSSHRPLSVFTPETQPSSCLFFRLPAELRTQIYHLVYSDHIIHLTLLQNHLVHDLLEVPEDIDDQVGSVPIVMTPARRKDEEGIVLQEHSDKTPLALSQTCHILYNETISLLYTTDIFSFDSPVALLYFHDKMLPRHGFQSIRHLRLYFRYDEHLCTSSGKHAWKRLWMLVAAMDLESLAVWLCHYRNEDVDVEREWMRPLFQVKGVQKIGVRVESEVEAIYLRVEKVEREIARRWTS